MHVLITGIDGYLGWPLAQYLTARGHRVAGADGLYRRKWVAEMGSWSAVPIAPMTRRREVFRARFGEEIAFWKADLRDYSTVEEIIRACQPDAVVHLAECPSAPYSMKDVRHASFVQINNIVTTFNVIFALNRYRPQAHMIKIGTMGEYGTPDIDIPEGFLDVDFRGRTDRLPFPRHAHSWYHLSKVAGSFNLMFACETYGLTATDVMQGVVFGSRIEAMGDDSGLHTRLDFDEAFGTVVNRFCCQAVIGEPLTPYGRGRQKRSFLTLQDAMHCVGLLLEHPPLPGAYRVVNQFTDVLTVLQVAETVRSSAESLGIECSIRPYPNPRCEQEEHYYNPDHQILEALGHRPQRGMGEEIAIMLDDLLRHRRRIAARRQVLTPTICWG